MAWSDRLEVKKGSLGEAMVDAYLKENGIIPYRPDHDGPHPFDRIAATPDKRYLCVVEVKTKAAREQYPDTGFDVRHHQQYLYLAMKYSMDVFVYFVDERAGCIYGGELIADLNRERVIRHNGRELFYPWTQRGIIYFPTSAMTIIAELSSDERRRLAEHTTGRYAQGSLSLDLG